MRILGIDPGLINTGWGCIDDSLRYIASGVLTVPASGSLGCRLKRLFTELTAIVEQQEPDEVAVEEVFVNRNGSSTMKLCMARGVVMVVPELQSISVCEYSSTHIKKTVTGNGQATKEQVRFLVKRILFGVEQPIFGKFDATDALAAAICHVRAITRENQYGVMGASLLSGCKR
jgi:crossover junction endodeoxyribonuclease RuvC